MLLHDSKQTLTIWRLLDGKPGHESQTLGLARALERVCARRGPCHVRCVDIPLNGPRPTLWHWLFRRFPPGFLKPRPDFIIGAGHRTHWPLLCARRAAGGRVIALMTPSLPRLCFDRIVAPWHDGVSGRNVIVTRGVLNAMRPGAKVAGHALIMVGGVSKHFPWHDDQVLAQIDTLMQRHPQALLTDSRRTPQALRAVLAARWPDAYHPWEQCPPGWLAGELAVTETAWVSEDSVSMIYEALTAGCAVGLITLAAPGVVSGRLARGIASLVVEGMVTRLDELSPGESPRVARPLLDEAERVAQLLLAAFAGAGAENDRRPA